MKYISKKFFQQLDFTKLIIVIDLQVLGVASIWGYSEIFGFRKGYDRNWAIVTLMFVGFSAIRFILTNVPQFSTWYFTKALKFPMKTLRANGGNNFLKYFGITYTIILDITLQILGAASIWAYSEICGYRSTPYQNKMWGKITMACSTIAFARYIMQSYHAYYNTEIMYPPTGHMRYFQAGLFDTLSIKKSILRDIGCHCSCSWLQNALSSHKYSESVYDSDASHQHVTVCTTDACFFCLGLGLHSLLTIVFEILGAGGAIWGQSEIVGLRKSPSSFTYTICAGVCSVVVFVSLASDYWRTSFALPTSQRVCSDPDRKGALIVDSSDSYFTELTPMSTQNPMQNDSENQGAGGAGGAIADIMRMGPTTVKRNPSSDIYLSLPAVDTEHHDVEIGTEPVGECHRAYISDQVEQDYGDVISRICSMEDVSLSSGLDVQRCSASPKIGDNLIGSPGSASARSPPHTPRIPPPQSPKSLSSPSNFGSY